MSHHHHHHFHRRRFSPLPPVFSVRRTVIVLLVMLLFSGWTYAGQTPLSPDVQALIDAIKRLNEQAQKLVQPPQPDQPPDPASNIIRVPSGADLQAALNSARMGQIIELAPGAVYIGNFKLPVKSPTATTAPILVRTSGIEAAVPPSTRIDGPKMSASLAKLKAANTQLPALQADDAAANWTIVGIEVLGNEVNPDRDSVVIGTLDMSTISQVPSNIILDRVYIHGGSKGGHRGVQFNVKNGKILNSDIRGFWEVGRDSQAIGIGNCPGPVLIENNYLEGSGENILIGGVDPGIGGLVNSDITIRSNYLFKPIDWQTSHKGSVKNLFELKNARHVLVEFNLFENNWVDAQAGHAIVFTPRNQGNHCPQCIVDDVMFQFNIVKNVGGFFINITGKDDINQVTSTSGRIKVLSNLFLSGSRGIMIGHAADQVQISHNTFPHISWAALSFFGLVTGKLTGLVYTDNVVASGSYGIAGEGTVVGVPTLDAFTDGPASYKFASNIIQLTTARTIRWPPSNFTIASGTLAAHLSPDFSYRPDEGQTSSDGKPYIGADITTLKSRLPSGSLFLPRPGVPTASPTRRQLQQLHESVMQ